MNKYAYFWQKEKKNKDEMSQLSQSNELATVQYRQLCVEWEK